MASPNPSGRALPERLAARTIAESIRDVVPGPELARILLCLASGIDPWADDARKRPNPDGLPVAGAVPLDWTHRMAALKMLAEYGYGKPLQGVIIDAQVRQETTVREERTTVVELRDVAARSPEARDALRVLARAMLGGQAPPAGRAQHGLARKAPELSRELAEPVAEHGGHDAGDDSLGALEEGEEPAVDVVELDHEVAVLHDLTLAGNAPGVKRERFPGFVP